MVGRWVLAAIMIILLGCPGSSVAQEEVTSENSKKLKKILDRYPDADLNRDGVLTQAEATEYRKTMRRGGRRSAPQSAAGNAAGEPAVPGKTKGFVQANTMGSGPAPIPEGRKFRVFILAGQSNITGHARASELKPPLNKKHDRIRIWARKRWEYFVPHKKFGPGVAMAHRLAEVWPEDTIGIIKVAVGGTGLLAWAPDWTPRRANLTDDAHKGALYPAIIAAVKEARKLGEFELAGFIWKQGGKDAAHFTMAKEYFQNFEKMITAFRKDLGQPDLPLFIATHMSDEEVDDQLAALKSKAPGLPIVLKAHNRIGREIPNTTVIHHGWLPTVGDNKHYNTEGQLTFGRMLADAIEQFYKVHPVEGAPREEQGAVEDGPAEEGEDEASTDDGN